MYWKIATSLQDRDIFVGERLSVERVDLAILNVLRQLRRRLMSLQFAIGRVLLCHTIIPAIAVRVLIGVHVSQVRVVLGIHLGLVHFLTLRSRTVLSLWTTIDHSGVIEEEKGRTQKKSSVF